MYTKVLFVISLVGNKYKLELVNFEASSEIYSLTVDRNTQKLAFW
jgi:hypothetical protein